MPNLTMTYFQAFQPVIWSILISWNSFCLTSLSSTPSTCSWLCNLLCCRQFLVVAGCDEQQHSIPFFFVPPCSNNSLLLCPCCSRTSMNPQCPICNVLCKNQVGLNIHIGRKHTQAQIAWLNRHSMTAQLESQCEFLPPVDAQQEDSAGVDNLSVSYPMVDEEADDAAGLEDDSITSGHPDAAEVVEEDLASDGVDSYTAGSSNSSYCLHFNPTITSDPEPEPETEEPPLLENIEITIPADTIEEADPHRFLGVPYRCTMNEQVRLLAISNDDYVMARMYKVCDKVGSPKYLCDKIIAVLKEEMRKGFNPLSTITQRKAYFPRIYKQMNVQLPEAVKIKLHTGAIATVYRFHFLTQLQNHLLSLPYADLTNLDLPNPDQPWSSTYPAGRNPGHTSLIDSTWYDATASSYKSELDNHHHLLHPLSLYIDKTGCDGIMKATLEPLMCTSGLLNQTNRQNVSNWFMIGCVPNLELSSKAKRSKESLQSLQDYHRCLEILLEPLKEVQRNMPV